MKKYYVANITNDKIFTFGTKKQADEFAKFNDEGFEPYVRISSNQAKMLIRKGYKLLEK